MEKFSEREKVRTNSCLSCCCSSSFALLYMSTVFELLLLLGDDNMLRISTHNVRTLRTPMLTQDYAAKKLLLDSLLLLLHSGQRWVLLILTTKRYHYRVAAPIVGSCVLIFGLPSARKMCGPTNNYHIDGEDRLAKNK